MQVGLAEEFARELAHVRAGSHLSEALGQITRRLGFDHYALNLEFRAQRALATNLLLHDYPDAWAEVYVGFDLAGQDPVRRACDKTFMGFAWGALEHLIPMTRGDRQMLLIGRECGIGDGFTVPRHLPGFVRGSCTFAVAPDRGMPAETLVIAETVGALALSCALRLGSPSDPDKPPVLTDRQRECVLWVARGKTACEIAMILGIGTETVIQHLKTARERYQVHSKQSLIVSALFDGMIGFADLLNWRDPD